MKFINLKVLHRIVSLLTVLAFAYLCFLNRTAYASVMIITDKEHIILISIL